MPDYSSWEESRGRIEDRFERLERALEAISRNVERLVWLLVSSILVIAGHAVVSYLQMAARH